MRLTGSAALWFQTLNDPVNSMDWDTFVTAICNRFDKDEHNHLLRHFFHIKHTTTVTEYVEQFSDIVHHILAHDKAFPHSVITNRFIDGLKKDVRTAVMMHRPQDLDTASSLALLQEEATQDSLPKRFESSNASKKTSNDAVKPVQATGWTHSKQVSEDKRSVEPAKTKSSTDESFQALKNYRRSKGLCFKCGEKWGPNHKCPPNVSLHAMEEFWSCLSDNEEPHEEPEDSDSGDDLMAISLQAVNGIEGFKTIRLRGHLLGKEVFMLIDSGSTHSFICDQLAQGISPWFPLKQPVKVQVANGELITCTHELKNQLWGIQGYTFSSTLKIIPLKGYDIILGMDWLSQYSPMEIHWVERWIKFQYNKHEVVLHGISSATQLGPPVSNNQLVALEKTNSLLYLVQLQASDTVVQPQQAVPPDLQGILDQFQSVFSPPSSFPPPRLGDHTIPLLEGAQPFCLKPYRYNPAQKTEIETQIADMLAKGWIQMSTSPYSSPALLVRKKTGDWRLCVDYRRLNALTQKNKYPLPIIEELLEELQGASWFTSLDLCSGFHQIRMAPGEEFKTAFQTHNGHYEYRVMPYGVTGGPTTFQSVMNFILAALLRKCVVVFIDDILIYSKTWDDHLMHISQVLKILQTHHFHVKLSKCSFAQQQLTYLGHIVSSKGVATDPSKITIIKDWPQPKNIKELRSFLGMVGYYRRFVKQFGLICKPLTNLLKKGILFIWISETEASFQALKKALISAPVLALPNFSIPFTVETDALAKGIGAVLQQQGHPIAFVSKALGVKAQGLSTYEKECLAILMAIDHWRHYLQTSTFTILTDQKSLVHLDDQKLSTPIQHKALTKLMGLSYHIVYKKGADNKVADALSRVSSAPSYDISAISVVRPLWLQEIQESYNTDPQTVKLLAELSITSAVGLYTLQDGLIRYKQRIWVGSNLALQHKILTSLHASAIGGHSGFEVTYKRVKQLFAWFKLKQSVQNFVAQCSVCQQAKNERVAYPGLLAPLPIPNSAWHTVTLDFIEGLPKSAGFNCILVVVDKFSKYAHFVTLSHPFTAFQVAITYLNNVFKLHGLPHVMISDRDKVFTSNIWQKLFKLVGTDLKMSSAYHPQTDGQTERVNQCLETYLRCFVHTCPTKWS
jgi:hypothetical protein